MFLDPDNGVGEGGEKHATFSEIRHLRSSNLPVAFITFPKRVKHDIQLQQLHQRLTAETDAKSIMTLRTSVSVRVGGSYVPRARWFTVVDPDAELKARAQAFATALEAVPRVRARVLYDLMLAGGVKAQRPLDQGTQQTRFN